MTEAAEKAFRELSKVVDIERVPNSDYLYQITSRGKTIILNEFQLEPFAEGFMEGEQK
jgi:hypothetical protein